MRGARRHSAIPGRPPGRRRPRALRTVRRGPHRGGRRRQQRAARAPRRAFRPGPRCPNGQVHLARHDASASRRSPSISSRTRTACSRRTATDSTARPPPSSSNVTTPPGEARASTVSICRARSRRARHSSPRGSTGTASGPMRSRRPLRGPASFASGTVRGSTTTSS